ncbi:MAG: family 16 glycosylhydrolase [Acutalibacteraceae bacterium]|nr:family 16 glycosylhydrolase [Acutalibacteraceae bacterium]
MNVKKIIALILTVLMVASLAACVGKGKAVPSGVNDDGRFIYTVIRSGKQTIPVIENAAKNVRAAIKDGFDVGVTISKDTVIEDFDNNYEILVGDTNREESATAKERLLANRDNNAADFIVAVINDKICINATKDEMVEVAANWFIDTFCDDLESWALLTQDYEFIYAPDSKNISNMVNGTNLGLYTLVQPLSTSYIIGMGVDDIIKYYSNFGYNIKKTTDFEEATEYEILVGDCDREASKAVTVEGDNYVIKVSGNKLIVKGGSYLSTWRAIVELYNLAQKGDINWADGYTINGKYDPNEEGAYTLNWNDEFEGTKVDYNKWSDYRNQAKDQKNASSLGGYIYAYDVYDRTLYTGSDLKDLVYVSDGSIVFGCQRVNEIDFVETTISTYWTMTYKYGLLEMRGDLPEYPAHASYWVNGASTSNPGTDFGDRFGYQNRTCMTEIDILENFSKDNSYAANVHRWWGETDADGVFTGNAHNSMDGNALYTGNSTNNKKFTFNNEKYGKNMTDDYHIYSFYWDESRMGFAFDGNLFCDYQYKDNYSVSVHCLMNYFISSCGMGSPSYGATYNKDTDGNYYEHKLDWVRLYQTGAKNSQLITSWPQFAGGAYEEGEKVMKGGTSHTYYPENSIGGKF